MLFITSSKIIHQRVKNDNINFDICLLLQKFHEKYIFSKEIFEKY